VVQLAPPLIIGPPEFADITSRLRSVLEGALAHI
jgi:adenosylmethionine-8-amino-7-oxononanoate aminotransferase